MVKRAQVLDGGSDGRAADGALDDPLYVDIIPKPEALGRYGLRVADVERIIESAIGGTSIGTTIEGRNRFTINVRYPRDLRGDLEALRRILVPIGRGGDSTPAAGSMGTHGALWPPLGSHGVVLADNMETMAGGGPSTGGGGPPRLTLPSGHASMSDASAGHGRRLEIRRRHR